MATQTANVPFQLPTASGGSGTVSVSCTPPPNAPFPAGETTVTCTGTDGARSGTCSFKVTLVPPQPVLRALRFLAFGDSITAGENGEDPGGGAGPICGGAALNAPQNIDLPNSYPTLLSGLLKAKYTTQSPFVTDCGIGRERADEGASRINAVLDAVRPDVVMILEGVNDLTDDAHADAGEISEALTRDIVAAKAHGLAGIMISTLLPQRPGGSRALHAGEIVPVNDTIRAVAQNNGAVLVDGYAAFAGHLEYLDTDGLHPLPAGNQAIAQQFLEAIQAHFEDLQPTAAFFARPKSSRAGVRAR